MGRNWSIQAAEAWGASEEALAFVTGKVGKEQAEREEERRARMKPQFRIVDKVALEAAGRSDLKEAMETVTGVMEGVYEAIGGAVGALREENLEWKRDLQAHMAATDRQNRKRHRNKRSNRNRNGERRRRRCHQGTDGQKLVHPGSRGVGGV